MNTEELQGMFEEALGQAEDFLNRKGLHMHVQQPFEHSSFWKCELLYYCQHIIMNFSYRYKSKLFFSH